MQGLGVRLHVPHIPTCTVTSPSSTRSSTPQEDRESPLEYQHHIVIIPVDTISIFTKVKGERSIVVRSCSTQTEDRKMRQVRFLMTEFNKIDDTP